jgi:ubiquinone/menaquinone biosynthesis C-methylase UbiE
MSVHADRFTGRVEDYERYRLRYPAAVLDVLRQRCGLRDEDVVADVGAGTGMVAELLLEAGNRVIAVEPNAEMRAACARLGSRYAKLAVVDAAAEATGLTTGSVDLVTVGRAFHWFDQARALAEFQRILKPAGWVTLVSSRRLGDESAQGRAYEAILVEHGTDYAQVRGNYRSYKGLAPYGDAERFEVNIPGEARLTLDEFMGQTQSLSIAPMPAHPKYEAMQQALHEFFAAWSSDGALTLETMCEIIGWRTPG